MSLQSSGRDEQRGLEAVNSLSKEGCPAKFHQLDILSQDSIQKLKKFLEEQYGGLDVLVNNAAIAYKVGDESFSGFNFVECDSKLKIHRRLLPNIPLCVDIMKCLPYINYPNISAKLTEVLRFKDRHTCDLGTTRHGLIQLWFKIMTATKNL